MDNVLLRHSTRDFDKEKVVNEEQIKQILRAGMQAPSAINGRPWEFVVVTNKDLINRLANNMSSARFIKDLSVVIVPCSKKDLICPPFKDIDMAACMENMLIEIQSMGLGACWIGVSPIEEKMNTVRDVLDIKNMSPFALLPIGYPKENIKPASRYEEERIHFIK